MYEREAYEKQSTLVWLARGITVALLVKFPSGSSSMGNGVEGVCVNGGRVVEPPYPGYVVVLPTGLTQ